MGSIRGLLAGIGALFALLPAGLANLWLLAHGLPVGFQNVPDLGSVPLVGEALKDVLLRVSLLGEWPFGGAWRLLLVAPVAGLVLGGIVAARGAPASGHPLQGALVAVPYAIIAALTAVLFGLDVSLRVAAVNVDLAFGTPLAWTILLLPVTAALGAVGGLLGWRGEAPVPRPQRVMLVTGAASALVLLLTLPVALVPLSGEPAVPGTAPEHPPIADIGPEPTVPAEPEETSAEPEPAPEPASSVSPDAPPDPAFDALLPTLRQMTTAPIMLPARLPEELSNVAVDSATGGDEYGILFLAQPTGDVVEDYVHAYDMGTIRSISNPQEVSPEFFDASHEETVELPDGTEATLRYLEPAVEGSNAAPFWEGRFEKEEQTYIVSVPLVDPEVDIARGILSSMVEVSGAEEEVSAEQRFISDYYAAVGREDWSATYSMLDPASQAHFTEEEWIRKQQAREAASGAPPIESATITEISGEGADFTATVTLTYEDGTQATLPGIVVVFEDGEHRRHLTDEELAFLEDF